MSTRRAFLLSTGAAALAPALVTLPTLERIAQAGAAERQSVAGRYVLTLDGKSQGFLTSVSGGEPYVEVVPGDGGKRPGRVRYEDIRLVVPVNTGRELQSWISSVLAGKDGKQNGEILGLDANQTVRSRLAFSSATLVELALGPIDAASRDAVELDLRLRPDSTRAGTGDGSAAPVTERVVRRSSASSFQLSIPGVDCTGVSRIEAITVRAGKGVDVSNLVLTVMDSRAADFRAWAAEAIRDGGKAEEKSGTLGFVGAAGKAEGAALGFSGLGMVRVASLVGGDEARRGGGIKVELYCERMSLSG